MKKWISISLLFCALLTIAGCRSQPQAQQPTTEESETQGEPQGFHGIFTTNYVRENSQGNELFFAIDGKKNTFELITHRVGPYNQQTRETGRISKVTDGYKLTAEHHYGYEFADATYKEATKKFEDDPNGTKPEYLITEADKGYQLVADDQKHPLTTGKKLPKWQEYQIKQQVADLSKDIIYDRMQQLLWDQFDIRNKPYQQSFYAIILSEDHTSGEIRSGYPGARQDAHLANFTLASDGTIRSDQETVLNGKNLFTDLPDYQETQYDKDELFHRLVGTWEGPAIPQQNNAKMGIKITETMITRIIPGAGDIGIEINDYKIPSPNQLVIYGQAPAAFGSQDVTMIYHFFFYENGSIRFFQRQDGGTLDGESPASGNSDDSFMEEYLPIGQETL